MPGCEYNYERRSRKPFPGVMYSSKNREIRRMTERFSSFSSEGCMSVDQFKKSMGLLGVGQAEYLSNRIFSLIADCYKCTCEQFIDFLDKINHGSHSDKVQLSFNYLDRQKTRFISYNDIEVIINEISFVWNFLTGQKISTTDLTQIICLKLGISQSKGISFQQYVQKYDQHFNWYDFFNNPIQPSRYHDKQPYSSIRSSSNQFKIDQIQEYLKFIHEEIQNLLFDFKGTPFDFKDQSQGQLTKATTNGSGHSKKGPRTIGAQQLQHRGDYGLNFRYYGLNFRQTLPYLNQEQLSQELLNMHQEVDVYDQIANKLEQLSQIATKLFTNRMIVQSAQQGREKIPSKHQILQDERKKVLKNITKPPKKRRNIVYFGHQNWNIMLNMMLGVRRSLKSHYYKFQEPIVFNEQDVTCKYYHELIYKKNDKSVKQISQIFVVYAPKVFFYIRKYSSIENYQVLKSIGLENLIGNLLLGNLSSVSDQTSEGKSGSFMYYTEDSKIIVKSINRQEYLKLRSIVEDYASYLRKNPDTYLMRIYGLYKMKNKSSGRSIYFIVIRNVFDQEEVDIDERYDIKGATHKRKTLENEQTSVDDPSRDKNVALKDVDLINNQKRTFDLDPDTKQRIFTQIIQDAQFLKRHNIIQYSLLIGIHYVQPEQLQKASKEINLFEHSRHRSFLSQNSQQIYFFGIIDILSEYSAAKKFQSGFFSILNFDISCKDPEEYFERFKTFIFKFVFSI